MNNYPTTLTITSMEIAGILGCDHEQILTDICRAIQDMAATRPYTTYRGGQEPEPFYGKNPVEMHFIESVYWTSQNTKLLCYELTRLGCQLLAMRMPVQTCVHFVSAYTERFQELERQHLAAQAKVVYPQPVEEEDEGSDGEAPAAAKAPTLEAKPAPKPEEPTQNHQQTAQLNESAPDPSSSEPRERLRLMYQFQEDTAVRVDTVEDRLQELEENAPIDPGDYNFIGQRVTQRVLEAVRTYGDGERQRRLLYRDLNGGIKAITGVGARSQLRRQHYQSVMDYIGSWEPSSATKTLLLEMRDAS